MWELQRRAGPGSRVGVAWSLEKDLERVRAKDILVGPCHRFGQGDLPEGFRGSPAPGPLGSPCCGLNTCKNETQAALCAAARKLAGSPGTEEGANLRTSTEVRKDSARRRPGSCLPGPAPRGEPKPETSTDSSRRRTSGSPRQSSYLQHYACGRGSGPLTKDTQPDTPYIPYRCSQNVDPPSQPIPSQHRCPGGEVGSLATARKGEPWSGDRKGVWWWRGWGAGQGRLRRAWGVAVRSALDRKGVRRAGLAGGSGASQPVDQGGPQGYWQGSHILYEANWEPEEGFWAERDIVGGRFGCRFQGKSCNGGGGQGA
ncbi:translation initiation factor IF-2-like [Meles meles]|uniref:translation initiation factor IF-2-like n=1 Tax=Meles meles TaxID=9662 RepID=UPI001E69B440|nr:translation initiation factor IF-2-like [Meles meles]